RFGRKQHVNQKSYLTGRIRDAPGSGWRGRGAGPLLASDPSNRLARHAVGVDGDGAVGDDPQDARQGRVGEAARLGQLQQDLEVARGASPGPRVDGSTMLEEPDRVRVLVHDQ